jgi:hypothetical protein
MSFRISHSDSYSCPGLEIGVGSREQPLAADLSCESERSILLIATGTEVALIRLDIGLLHLLEKQERIRDHAGFYLKANLADDVDCLTVFDAVRRSSSAGLDPFHGSDGGRLLSGLGA